MSTSYPTTDSPLSVKKQTKTKNTEWKNDICSRRGGPSPPPPHHLTQRKQDAAALINKISQRVKSSPDFHFLTLNAWVQWGRRDSLRGLQLHPWKGAKRRVKLNGWHFLKDVVKSREPACGVFYSPCQIKTRSFIWLIRIFFIFFLKVHSGWCLCSETNERHRLDTLSKWPQQTKSGFFFTMWEKEQKTQNNATTLMNTDHVWNWFRERMF